MANGKTTANGTSAAFGPDIAATERQKQFTWQNGGGSRVYIVPQGETAVASVGFFLDPGREISSKDLPDNYLLGRPSCITASGTADLFWDYR